MFFVKNTFKENRNMRESNNLKQDITTLKKTAKKILNKSGSFILPRQPSLSARSCRRTPWIIDRNETNLKKTLEINGLTD